ncbi:hypothetical protein KCU93_g8880, partial [Aureobasidium melanogenum]
MEDFAPKAADYNRLKTMEDTMNSERDRLILLRNKEQEMDKQAKASHRHMRHHSSLSIYEDMKPRIDNLITSWTHFELPLRRLKIDFHESNTMYFEPELVELVLSNGLFVFRYISGNLRHLRVSCVNSLLPLNEASVELVDKVVGAESHANIILSLVDYSPGLETLIIDARIFDVP